MDLDTGTDAAGSASSICSPTVAATSDSLPDAGSGECSVGLARAAAVAETMGLFAAVAGEAASWATAERRAVLTFLDRSIDVLTTVRATVLVAERDS
ncbi:hypothetical protein, partial [Pengzhenrongella sp.]|uniref:hypothetical protein n=1 Tax=Pengzhenrongella sp. TaxID=2888820 RepID=UPI002F93089F